MPKTRRGADDEACAAEATYGWRMPSATPWGSAKIVNRPTFGIWVGGTKIEICVC